MPARVRRGDLRGPDIGPFPLAHRREDRGEARTRLDDRPLAVERHHRQQFARQLRAVQQHAERPAYPAEDAEHVIDDM